MPFYEYQCKNCGHELEAMQKVSDAPLKKCPDCGKAQLKRLMSAPVFRLKGGGWYETDFKDKDNQRNLADQPEAAAKDKDKDADAKPKDDQGKDGKDAKTADPKPEAPAKESATGKEKAAEKPAEKAAAKSADRTADKTAERSADKPSRAAGKSAAKRSARGMAPKRKPAKLKRRR
ncbi:MAG TPA: zinc ribbon domain-containing protein [Steroidobacteraceae bacterium]|jgi:putative FmdB family regulatory protein|nr:zinc ribbon domain-containing protein [Steroidobacteraceae bacterium]